MAAVIQSEEGHGNLLLITEVFRPFLLEYFHLTAEFLSHLTEKGALDNGDNVSESFLSGSAGLRKLLDHLAKSNRKGSYTAFIEALRNTGQETVSFKYVADLIEGINNEEYEDRELIRQIMQLCCVRFCNISPEDLLPYLHDITTEEKENVVKTTGNHGDHRGAFELFRILLTKGKECFQQLIKGLRETGHPKLAHDMDDLFGPEATDSEIISKKLGAMDDISLVIKADQQAAYSGGTPPDDNTSVCDSLSDAGAVEATGELNLYGPGPPDKDVNINNSTDEKKSQTSIKTVPSQNGEENENEPSSSENGEQNEDEPSTSGNVSQPSVIPIELYGYQEELVSAALHGKNSVVVAPTGSGKTVVAARVAKAVLDREPGVGSRTGDGIPLDEGGSNKVIFIVNKVPLVKQQCDLFKKYIDGRRILGLSGEVGLIGSMPDLLEKMDVLVMTAQILVNALQARDGEDNHNRMELSKIGLIILDECHHCQKGNAYNEIMAEYCYVKQSSPEKARPQVLGLTASMGVGKAKTRYKAVSHILNVCANLDAQKLCTVQDQANLEELKTKRDKPTEEILTVQGRQDDSFKREIDGIMAKIEDFITETPGGDIIRKESSDIKCPISRGTQVYEQWTNRMLHYIAGEIEEDNYRMRLVTCVDHLQVYNNSLYVNRDARTLDALKYLQHSKYLSLHQESDEPDSFQKQIVNLFKEKEDYLKEISESPANKNPLLKCLSDTLIKALSGKEHSRGILFCKTRAATDALLAWIEMTQELTFLKPGRLIGSGGTGMTQKQQTELLSLFRDGNHQLIIATSVAEEGLDIKQCNVVIRYNYISNDIGRVQAQGRNRARGGKFYLIVSEELGLHEREIMNQIREKMMFEATQTLQKMPEDDFLMQIAKNQEGNRLERKLKKNKKDIQKHNKKLMEVKLTCRKCGTLACTADDIRCIEDAHRIVLNDVFAGRAIFANMKHRSLHADMELIQKIQCGNTEKSCPQEWGSQMLYKTCLVNMISPSNFVMKMPKGPPRIFKKWKDVPFKVKDVTLEELDKICNLSDEEEEEEEVEVEDRGTN